MERNRAGAYWLASERVVAALVGLLTTFLVARFMGPVDFGTFAFIFASIGLGLAAGQLGMDSLLVRSFVKSDRPNGDIIGTAILIKAIANVISFGVVVVIVFATIDGSQTELRILMLSASVFALSSVTTVLGSWFKAREEFRSLFNVRVIAAIVSLAAKVAVVAFDLSIVAMAAAHILYFVMETVVCFVLFTRRKGAPVRSWIFDRSIAGDLFSRGLPLFFGTMVAATYMNIDMIMLRFYWDARTVGEYALIPQMLNAVQIIPYAITSAAFPAILALVGQNSDRDAAALCRRIYGQLLLFSVAALLLVVFVVRPLTPLVFGAEYEAALTPMLVAALAIPIIFMRHLGTKLFVAHSIRYDFVKMELAGLAANIFLNLLLIPLYAGVGAAIATGMAYFVSTIVMAFVFKRSRAIFLPILRPLGRG